jgi:hypothetical protein
MAGGCRRTRSKSKRSFAQFFGRFAKARFAAGLLFASHGAGRNNLGAQILRENDHDTRMALGGGGDGSCIGGDGPVFATLRPALLAPGAQLGRPQRLCAALAADPCGAGGGGSSDCAVSVLDDAQRGPARLASDGGPRLCGLLSAGRPRRFDPGLWSDNRPNFNGGVRDPGRRLVRDDRHGMEDGARWPVCRSPALDDPQLFPDLRRCPAAALFADRPLAGVPVRRRIPDHLIHGLGSEPHRG